MEKIDNGIYTDLSITDYHRNGTHISATSIKEARASLKRYQWFRSGKLGQKQAEHFDLGNAFEIALLDKANFEKYVAIAQTEYWTAKALEEKPDLKVPKSSTAYKAYKSKFESENEDKYIIQDVGDHSFQSIELMLESCYSDPTIKKLIEGIEYQLSLFWTDKETGLNVKTRPDICKTKKNVVVNLKTAVDGSPESFSRDLAKWDYPLQAAVEITGCIESGLMPRVDNYFWLVVEKEPPFCATLYEFDKSDVELAIGVYKHTLRRIAEAKESDIWPGYTDRADNKHGILQARIPNYYFI